MSRIVEIETQQTVNATQVIDRTVNILNDNEEVILEYFELIAVDQDGALSNKTFNHNRHKRNKDQMIKSLEQL